MVVWRTSQVASMVVVMMRFAICIWGQRWCLQYIQKVMNDTERKKEERSNLKRNNHCHWQYRFNFNGYDYDAKCAWERGGEVKRTTPEIPQTVVTVHSKTNYRAWKDKGSKVGEKQKNNTRDSNVVPHRSTNLARQCLTSLSRREAVLSLGVVVPGNWAI